MSAPPSVARTPTIRVLVVDDSAAYRAGLEAVIGSASELALMASVATGDEACAWTKASKERPDLVIVDVHLLNESGFDVTRRLLAIDPSLRIVLASTMEEVDLASDARSCGAVGFVPKRLLGPRALTAAARGAYDWA